jgi:hypothetical protein
MKSALEHDADGRETCARQKEWCLTTVILETVRKKHKGSKKSVEGSQVEGRDLVSVM